MNGGTVKGRELFACPFCKGQFGPVDLHTERPGLVHSMPTCKEFRVHDPETFTRLAREAFERAHPFERGQS